VYWGRLDASDTLIASGAALLASAWVCRPNRDRLAATGTRWRRLLIAPSCVAVVWNFAFVVLLGVRPTRQLNSDFTAWEIWSWIFLLLLFWLPVAGGVGVVAALVCATRRRWRAAADWSLVAIATFAAGWIAFANSPDV
jgi:amino acid transporter